MRLWFGVLVLLALAAAAAFGWHWLAGDPGYVLVRVRGTTIETSLVFAIVALLVAWAVVSIFVRFARWPFRAWGRAYRRRGRERLASGLTALAEGRYAEAERNLAKASNHSALRGPALLAIAQSAHERGSEEHAREALGRIGAGEAAAALALRAQFLIGNGRAGEALALLKPKAASGTLPPRALRLLVDAALASGDTRTALDAIPALARTQALAHDDQIALDTRALAAALAAAPDAARLNALWSGASRAQRRRPELIAAFARRSAAQGQVLAAMDEIESAERREWSDALALAYADLGPAELAARTRKAESWLALAPNSAALATALGRLCAQQSLWGKGQQYLERAIAIDESPLAWETLGDCYAGADDAATASRCYANALRLGRGEETVAVAPHALRGPVDTRALAFEERSEHGVPRLPGAKSG
ncbi:MAG TPA: heme biosynthesis HemY N-terminal domain-containing protein [Rhodanobacteraceae bacterium]|nr:heme biosynthesis HemY N-terminal domain-containing protein [Rhodanobacteraceae bacterium]